MRTLTELTRVRPARTWWSNSGSCVNQRLSILQTMQLLAPINDVTNHVAAHRADDGRAKESWTRSATSSLARKPRRRSALVERQRTLDASHRRSFLIGIVGMPLGVLASLILIALFTERTGHPDPSDRGDRPPVGRRPAARETERVRRRARSARAGVGTQRHPGRRAAGRAPTDGDVGRADASDEPARVPADRRASAGGGQTRPSDHGVDVPRPGRAQARERHARSRRGRCHAHGGSVRDAGNVPGRRPDRAHGRRRVLRALRDRFVRDGDDRAHPPADRGRRRQLPGGTGVRPVVLRGGRDVRSRGAAHVGSAHRARRRADVRVQARQTGRSRQATAAIA